ncbi:unnamed protein product [Miscanthus lutarioriparius]|uniref:DUF4220 domain-containing protein n=1 Tax=Miscanthus lutarioriparius TaxID=422564 RepID=A0A811RXA9_9POAL|nr:unnamed protein product [Miscanthus lutarioriparius]
MWCNEGKTLIPANACSLIERRSNQPRHRHRVQAQGEQYSKSKPSWQEQPPCWFCSSSLGSAGGGQAARGSKDLCGWLTHSVTAYDLDETKQWKKQLFEQVDSGGSRSESQLLQGSRSESEPDPIRMEGGRYLVRWYGYFLNTHGATAHGYRTKLSEEDIITVDMIWEKCSDMLPFDPSGGSQSKDVCLSFALFHLLKRRYFGINCYEAGLQKTRGFVLSGLLASEDGKRAFRITVEDVKLPDTVKPEIASSLKSIAPTDHLTNGEASLQRNELFITPFKETLRRDGWDLTDTMLIWHIATNCCETGLTPAVEISRHGKLRHYREVATTLSRYSAYLMASVPELLPGNPTYISFTFDKVMQEATVVLYPGQEEDIRERAIANRDMLTEALNRSRPSDQEDHNNDTIFFRGLKLGKELEDHIDNEEIRWKVLAEFWAEIILYVAPSDNVRGHVERLANGGEFITHIWALLSHAGILTRHLRQQESSQRFTS